MQALVPILIIASLNFLIKTGFFKGSETDEKRIEEDTIDDREHGV